MTKAKVLIHVRGGVAYWSSTDDVEVICVDEDNINAGDPKVEFSRDWQPLLREHFGLSNSKYVTVGADVDGAAQ